jgi:hypothetical protein
MPDHTIRMSSPSDVYPNLVDPGSKVPHPDDIFLNPVGFIDCLRKIAPLMVDSGVWWALGGDAGENLLDVHVRAGGLEILTHQLSVKRVAGAVAGYNPTPVAVRERELDRQATPDDKSYPVYVRSTCTEFTVAGVSVAIHGDYQMKVGDWEWGDPFIFEPVLVNVAGVQIPVMPLRLKSEIYMMLGWLDRVELISDATARAHHFLTQFGEQAAGGT